jgi:hypothetical protein
MRLVLVLSCKIVLGHPSKIKGQVEVPNPCKILRTVVTSTTWAGVVIAEFFSGEELLPIVHGGPFDLTIFSILEGLTLPKGKLSMKGDYHGFIWPGMPPGFPIRYCASLACETTP